MSNLSSQSFQAKKEAKLALSRQGLLRKGSDPKLSALKLPSAEQLSLKRVDPAKLEVCFVFFLYLFHVMFSYYSAQSSGHELWKHI